MREDNLTFDFLTNTGNDIINKFIQKLSRKYSWLVDLLLNKEGSIDFDLINDVLGNLDPELKFEITEFKNYIISLLELIKELNDSKNYKSCIDILSKKEYENILINDEIYQIVLSKVTPEDKENFYNNPKFSLIIQKNEIFELLKKILGKGKIIGKDGVEGVFREICSILKNNGILKKYDKKILLDAYFSLIKGNDIFLDNPPKKPKEDIANHISMIGGSILTPDRFKLDQLKNEINKGQTIIVRSEHIIEYNGPSGFFDSFIINSKIIKDCLNFIKLEQGQNYLDYLNSVSLRSFLHKTNKISLFQVLYSLYLSDKIDLNQLKKYIKIFISQTLNFKDYCSHYGLIYENEKNKVLDGLDFSYWKYEPGFNRTITADSAIKGRYHIITTGEFSDRVFTNYSIYDNGELIKNGDIYISGSDLDCFDNQKFELLEIINSGSNRLVGIYEKIRNLNGFDPKHCPIMEFQTPFKVDPKDCLFSSLSNYGFDGSKFKFLQYHRGLNQDLTNFVLDRPLEDGEYEASFVRGKTLPEGIIVDIDVEKFYNKGKYCFDTTEKPFLKELIIRELEMLLNINYLSIYSDNLGCHSTISTIFKPNIFIKIKGYLEKQDGVNKISFRIISDGKRCFVKVLTEGVCINFLNLN